MCGVKIVLALSYHEPEIMFQMPYIRISFGISLEKFRAEVIFIIQVKVNSACLHFRSQQQACSVRKCSAYNFRTKSEI